MVKFNLARELDAEWMNILQLCAVMHSCFNMGGQPFYYTLKECEEWFKALELKRKEAYS